MNNPRVSIIVAAADNGAIGKDNKLLWNIPEDMKRFREVTSGHTVIMGRKTYESIGRPLPHRTNIVISGNPELKIEGCIVCNSLEEALKKGKETERDELFILGGSSIYRQSIPYSARLYLTRIKGSYEADSFFPIDHGFEKVLSEEPKDNGTHQFTFTVLEKI